MLNIISVVALIFSLGGNILVNFKKRIGFPTWIISNFLWVLVNLIGTPNISQIIMYMVYIILNIQGYTKWSKLDKEKTNDIKSKT